MNYRSIFITLISLFLLIGGIFVYVNVFTESCLSRNDEGTPAQARGCTLSILLERDEGKLNHLYARRGIIYYNEGMYLFAISDFTRTVERHSEMSWLEPTYIIYLRGRSYLVLSRYDEALTDFTKAIEVEGSSSSARPQYLLFRGITFLKKSDASSALEDFDKAFAGSQKSALALYARGLAKITLGRLEDGKADLETATSQVPNVAESFRALGL